MVAEPVLLAVQGDDKEILAVHLPQQLLALRQRGRVTGGVWRCAYHGFTERLGHPLQNRSPHQVRLPRRRQGRQHLIGQEFQGVPVATAPFQDAAGVLVLAQTQGERCQPQPRHPAFGARIQLRDGRAIQRASAGSDEKGGRLLQAEAQVARTNVHHLVTRPPLAQRQLRVVARHQDEVQPGVWMTHHLADHGQRVGVADGVEVVEHQGYVAGYVVQVKGKLFDERPGAERDAVVDHLRQFQPEAGHLAPNGGHQIGHERREVIVPLIERQPGADQAAALQPGADGRRLAIAGRGRNEGQWPACDDFQALLQADPRHVIFGSRRIEQLGRVEHMA